jgi:hypothetical protein
MVIAAIVSVRDQMNSPYSPAVGGYWRLPSLRRYYEFANLKVLKDRVHEEYCIENAQKTG